MQENSAARQRLEAHFQSLESQMQDHRTTRLTLDAFDSASLALSESLRIIEPPEGQRDPFVASAEIDKFARHADELDAMLVSDRNAHAEASRAVLGAEAELRTAHELIHRAHRDEVPDSRATSDSIAEIRSVETAIVETRQRLESKHDDWSDVSRQATQCNARLGEQAGRLRGELKTCATMCRSASSGVQRS